MNHSATNILFVHGWWGGPWVWDLFRQPFAEQGIHCSAIDLNWNPKTAQHDLASFEVHLERLKAAVNAIHNPIVVGHSAGGLLIQKLLETTSVEAAVLLASAAPRWIFPVRSFRLTGFAFRYATEMLRGRPFLPGFEDMIELNLNALSKAEQSHVYQRMIPVSGHQAAEVAIAGVAVSPPSKRPPMLVIYGTQDRLTPPSIGRAIATKFGAQSREYPANAHYLLREPNHRQIATEIVEWLKSVGVATSHEPLDSHDKITTGIDRR